MHKALRYLPYLLIGTANPYKKMLAPRFASECQSQEKRNKNEENNITTNQFAYYGVLGFRHTF